MTGSDRMAPRERIAAECRARGTSALISGCIDVLDGREVDDGLILALGGESAPYVLSGREGGKDGYWPRVWAARGLLHAWDDQATAAIIRATADDAWRVREMAAKVVARHRVDDALSAMAGLQNDDVPRVRQAAGRAIVVLTASSA
jgi:HEAT repeat protein